MPPHLFNWRGMHHVLEYRVFFSFFIFTLGETHVYSKFTTSEMFPIFTQQAGYSNNIRLVEPKKGTAFRETFYSCDILSIGRRFFNLNTVFSTVMLRKDTEGNLVKRCQDAVNANKKVLIDVSRPLV